MQRAQRPHPAAPTINRSGILEAKTLAEAAAPGDGGIEREAGEDAAEASETGGVEEQGWTRISFLKTIYVSFIACTIRA